MPATARGPMKDFQFDGEFGDRQKIDAVVPLKAYLVKYHDAEGKQQVRVAVTVPGTDTGLVAQHQISGTQVFAPMTRWFHTQLNEKIDSKADVESI